MTQTYRDDRGLAWMRHGLCPECGERPEGHSGAQEFWLRDPLRCDLLPRGVMDRIAKQNELDGAA